MTNANDPNNKPPEIKADTELSLDELRAKTDSLKASVEAKENLFKRLEHSVKEHELLKTELGALESEVNRLAEADRNSLSTAFKRRLNDILRIEFTRLEGSAKK